MSGGRNLAGIIICKITAFFGALLSPTLSPPTKWWNVLLSNFKSGIYLYDMKLEDVIKSNKFGSEKQKAAINVLYTGYWLRSGYSSSLKKEDLTLEQYNVLRILRGRHPEQMCVKDIAGRIIEKSSNVPRIIDRLVVKKLARRTTSKEDKRETLVSLTDKGISVLEKANLLTAEVTDGISHLTEDDAKTLNELLEKMRMGS
jgi:DNA-binding MarR family transcriptional regulator